MRCIYSTYHEPADPFYCEKIKKQCRDWTQYCPRCYEGKFRPEPRWHTKNSH